MPTPRSALVVGGGVIGCALARELASLGIETTVLERASPGSEASGAAAGLLAPQAEALPRGALFDLALASRNLYASWSEELASETGIDVGFRRTGVLRCATSPQEGVAFAHRYAWQRDAGLAIEEAGPRRIAALSSGLVAGNVVQALSFPDEGVVDPPSLVRALALSAERRGVRILAGRRVRRFAVEGGVCVGVDAAPNGAEGDAEPGAALDRFEADCVVDAAGAWAAFDPGVADPPVEPIRGQIVELRPTVSPPVVLWSEDVYLVPRADGRLLLGSTEERVGFVKEVTAGAVAHLIDSATRLVPDLSRAAYSRAWSGLRPGSADGLPILGPSPVPRLWLSAGHYRNGILLAPVTARLVASAIAGDDPPALRPFSPGRFRADPSPSRNRGAGAIFG